MPTNPSCLSAAICLCGCRLCPFQWWALVEMPASERLECPECGKMAGAALYVVAVLVGQDWYFKSLELVEAENGGGQGAQN